MSVKTSIYQSLPLSIKIKYDIKKSIKNKIQKQKVFINNKPRVYIIGESDNGNVGDLAITVTHYNILKKHVGNDCQIIRILFSNFWEYYIFLKENIRECDLITIPGGGNIGDVYFEAEMIRQIVINEFKNNEIIVFPSTVFFSKGYESNELYQRSLKIYNNHNNLTIFAREKYSYEILKKSYNNTNIYLIPDMVFQYKYNNDSINRENKILLCLRNDDEKNLTNDNKNKIYDICSQLTSDVIFTNTFQPEIFAPEDEERVTLINQKLSEFSSAKLIITDRLHGMVLAYLAKTPCVVFANYNHKIKGVYKWIEEEENVFFVFDFEDGINKIHEMYGKNKLKSKNIEFDYEILENQIKKWWESNDGKNKW